jgi:heme A synthase
VRVLIKVFRVAFGFDVAQDRRVRVGIEVVHIFIGLVAAALIGWASAWSYPRATDDIWLVAFACMAAVVLMGIGPVRRAYYDHPADLTRKSKDVANG